jgi:hypothetical protein
MRIDLSATQRYTHLSPAATEDAIRLLDGRLVDATGARNRGDIVETDVARSGSNVTRLNLVERATGIEPV